MVEYNNAEHDLTNCNASTRSYTNDCILTKQSDHCDELLCTHKIDDRRLNLQHKHHYKKIGR